MENKLNGEFIELFEFVMDYYKPSREEVLWIKGVIKSEGGLEIVERSFREIKKEIELGVV